MSIHDLIGAFDEAPSTSRRGMRFEQLMVHYFNLDPVLSGRYTGVVPWMNWPHREGSPDVGIDLVARDLVTGGWVAIQCKFYSPRSVIRREDIDSFISASGRRWDGERFTHRIIVSTTDRWSTRHLLNGWWRR